MYKRKIYAEDKIYAVNLYPDGKESQHRIASMFGVSTTSVQQWIRNYAITISKRMISEYFAFAGKRICWQHRKLPLVFERRLVAEKILFL